MAHRATSFGPFPRNRNVAKERRAGVRVRYRPHDADSVQLYLHETFTFLSYTAEASVALTR